MTNNRFAKPKLVQHLAIPAFLLGLTVLAYTPLINKLGFYWDDFPLIWFGHLLGPSGYSEVLSGDRPFLAIAYWISTNLLGENPLQWQIFSLVLRWLVTLSVWWLATLIWKPGGKPYALWIAALFAVYPGFLQQPISVIYANGYLLLIAFFCSLAFTVKALQNPQKVVKYTLFAIVLDIFCSFSTEYYFGLNLIRYLLIFLFIRNQGNGRKELLFKSLKRSLPYIGSMLAFLIWRVAVFGFPTYQPQGVDTLTSGQTGAFFKLLYRVIADPVLAGFQAWARTFRFPSWNDFFIASQVGSWLVFIAGLVFMIGAFILMNRTSYRTAEDEESGAGLSFRSSAGWLGLASLVLAGIPYWGTNLPIKLLFPWDRFTLAFMLGSAILLVWLMERLIRKAHQIQWLLAVLVAFACSSHFLNSLTFAREWESQKNMFQQLTWRAPSLKPGTTLLTFNLPLKYYSDNSLTAPLNWIYAPDNHSETLPYLFAFSDVRLGASIPSPAPNQPIEQTYRNAIFHGNTSDMLVIQYSPPSCLHVVSESIPFYNSKLLSEFEPLISASNLALIMDSSTPAELPIYVYGHSSTDNWCYFFEKADLAVQNEDWETAASLMTEASQKALGPADAVENFPFILAYAHLEEWERVWQILEETYKTDKNLEESLCQLTSRIEPLSLESSKGKETISRIYKLLPCDAY